MFVVNEFRIEGEPQCFGMCMHIIYIIASVVCRLSLLLHLGSGVKSVKVVLSELSMMRYDLVKVSHGCCVGMVICVLLLYACCSMYVYLE